MAKVQACLHTASRSAAEIARFVLASPLRVRSMSVYELAEACGTSPATVSRFARALGYGGYKEFQLDLAGDLAQADAITLDDLPAGSAPEVIVRQVFGCNRQSLIDTEKSLDLAALVQAARLIKEARRVLLIGIGESARVAEVGAQRLLTLGLDAAALTDPYDQIFATASVGRGHVVIGISHTGQTAHVVEAVRAAREQGARTVALTNYPRSPLAEAAEFRLITAFHERRISAAVSSSRIAQECIIDSLYFIVASWTGKGKALADAAERRVQKMIRYKEGKRNK